MWDRPIGQSLEFVHFGLVYRQVWWGRLQPAADRPIGLVRGALRLSGPVQKDLDQGGMPVQWLRGNQLYVAVKLSNATHDSREVTLEVEAQGQKIGNDDDPPETLSGKQCYGPREIGLAEFKEGSLDPAETTRLGQFRGYRPNGLVSRLDARAVGEDDDRGTHALPWIYARIWCSSSVLRASS